MIHEENALMHGYFRSHNRESGGSFVG